MLSWLNINASSPSVFPYLSVLSLTYSLDSCPPAPLFRLSTHPHFHSPPPPPLSSVCPIWTVTCLIFSRPSSPLCRALLPSPTPTVPGEVRYLHTQNECTSRDADMQITETRAHTLSDVHKWIYSFNIPSGQSFPRVPIHLFSWKLSIHHRGRLFCRS